jgi:hypothetical protein
VTQNTPAYAQANRAQTLALTMQRMSFSISGIIPKSYFRSLDSDFFGRLFFFSFDGLTMSARRIISSNGSSAMNVFCSMFSL